MVDLREENQRSCAAIAVRLDMVLFVAVTNITMTMRLPFRWQVVGMLLCGVLSIYAGAARASDAALDLLDLSLEELADIRVTTALRIEEPLRETAASVFVITGDEIRRSGVTSIPEALRLAPGVEVARRNAHAWSISIRGFNSDLSDKLLVLIDGRSVYSPLYAGVFWDVQDTLIEDIDRIEIVAGPGGSLWGANAVNGVINIITRSASDTKSGFGEFGAGNEQGTIGLRYGGTIGNRIDSRIYIKGLDRDPSETPTGGDGIDGTRIARGGFRLDWQSEEADSLTLQGDVYSGTKEGEFLDDFSLGSLPAGSIRDEVDIAGGNVLGLWRRRLSDASDMRLQFYVDQTRRDIPHTYGEDRDSYDVDFQHHRLVGNRHELVWGLGFRRTSDDLTNTQFASFTPDSRTDRTRSAFFQDQFELREDALSLIFGAKLEANDYTGSEVQPNARISWKISADQYFWTAVSRAVRIPSRLDSDLRLTVPISLPDVPFPVYVVVNGNPEFDAEDLLAREAGYRKQFGDSVSFDVSVFRNSYTRIQTTEPEAPIIVLDPDAPYAVLPNVLRNGMDGTVSGGTVEAVWHPRSGIRVRFQYSRLDAEFTNSPGSEGSVTRGDPGSSPERQLGVHAYFDLADRWSIYTGARYVSALANQQVESYVSVDANLRWTFDNGLATSLTIRNLNDDHHREFRSGGGQILERDVLARVSWSF